MVPEGWAQHRFGEVVALANGQVDPKEEPYASMPHIGPENIQSGTGKLSKVRTAAECKVISGKYQFDEHAIVYSKIRPNLNKLAKPGYAGICSADMYPIWGVAGVTNTDFLFHLMLSDRFVGATTAVSLRTGMPKINRPDLNAIKVNLPPLPEQRKIADILSTWDEAIEKTEALLTNARTQKRALMQQLLTGKRRFPEFEGQPWNSGKLVDHFDFINGRAFKPDDWGDEGIPIIRIQNLTGSTDAINYYDGAIEEKHTIRPGDFLLSWSATLDTFIWAGPVAVLNQHIFKVVPKSDTLKMFGFHLITHEIGKLVSKVHGTSMKHITKKDLAKIESFFPSLAEQEKITDALDDAERFVNDTQADLAKLRTEKKALMQQLLTGKRRVNVEDGYGI